MSSVAIYDANVLYGNLIRDLLIRVARSHLVQAKWTDQILDETFQNLRANRPDIPVERLDHLRKLILASVKDCLVDNFEPLIGGVSLPDADDRHVLAAAIKAGARVIVTWNTSDFPDDTLRIWDLQAQTPDDFLVDLIGIDDRRVWTCVQQIADSHRNPPETVADILDGLERVGLVRTAATLRSGTG